jgi:hypothetical protein
VSESPAAEDVIDFVPPALESAPRKKAAPLAEPPVAETLEADEVIEGGIELVEGEDDDVEVAVLVEDKKKARHFSLLGLLFLFLGVLSIPAVAGMLLPYFEGPTLTATGNLARHVPSKAVPLNKALKDSLPLTVDITDEVPFVIGIPVGIAVLGLLAFLIAAVRKRFGVASLFPTYLAWLASVVVLVLMVMVLVKQQGELNQREGILKNHQRAGITGTYKVSLGEQYYVGVGGAGAAAFFFMLALIFMHRKAWARMAFLSLAVLVTALGVGLAFYVRKT